jgi:PAS domain-containing protein
MRELLPLREVNPLDLVETIREGILVLKPDLTIRFANRSFCHTFAVAPKHIVGRKLYEIDNGQWNIPKCQSASKIDPRSAFKIDPLFGRSAQR